jgi:hypothetical protein
LTAEIDKGLLEPLGMPGLKISGDPESIRKWKYNCLVGAFVQAWTMLEFIFDLCIRAIFEMAPGGRALAKENRLPSQLGEKIKFFKDAHKKLKF